MPRTAGPSKQQQHFFLDPNNNPSAGKSFSDAEEEEAWPALNVGDLLCGLDKDLSSSTTTTMSATTTTTASSSPAGSGPGSPPPQEQQKAAGVDGEDVAAALAADDAAALKDKDLKIKIKRTKSGGHKTDSKLEIVPKEDGGEEGTEEDDEDEDSAGAPAKISGPLSADAVVSAVTAAVAKQNGGSGKANSSSKVKLVGSGASNGPKKSKAAKNNGAATNGKKSKAAAAESGPPAKRQKVRKDKDITCNVGQMDDALVQPSKEGAATASFSCCSPLLC